MHGSAGSIHQEHIARIDTRTAHGVTIRPRDEGRVGVVYQGFVEVDSMNGGIFGW